MYSFGPFSVDPSRRVLTRGGQSLAITARTFDVLLALLERSGQTVGKDQLLRTVWPDTVVEEANLSQHIFTIRKLLGATETEPYIATVPRRGYQFVAPVINRAPAPAAIAGDNDGPSFAGPIRLEIPLPPHLPLALRSSPAIALAADGSIVAFVVADGSTTRICLRALGDFAATPIAGTDGAANPFFSPDGRWLGFEANRRLWKVPVAGGKPLALCEVAELRGAAWTTRDEIVYAPGPTTGLWRIHADGGDAQPLTSLDFAGGERTHRWPHALSDGCGIIFTIGHAGATSFDEASLAIADLTGERRLVLQHATDGRCLPGRQMLWARGGTLLAAPFDPSSARVEGPPRIVAQGVAMSATGAAQVACSRNGVLVHVAGEAQTLHRVLVTVDRSGTELSRHAAGEMLEEPRWAGDRSTAIVSLRNRSSDLWSYDFNRGVIGRLTFDGENFAGIWGPGAGAITFSSSDGGPADLFVLQSDRSSPPELLVCSEFDKVAGSWSPDGETLVFTEYHPATGADLWLLERRTERARPFVQTRFNEYAPVFSPDGRYVAYVTDESGRPEVVVVDATGAGKQHMSTDGGTEPVWSADGRELFYRSGDRLMHVDVGRGIAHAGIPTTLFEGSYARGTVTLANYDVSRDGSAFLMVRAVTAAAPLSLRVTIGWQD